MDTVGSSTAKLEGIEIALLDLQEILGRVALAICERSALTIGYVNAHVLNSAARSSELRQFLQESELVYCDGIGPLWALRAEGYPAPTRIPGRIAIPKLMQMAAHRDWKIAWLGGKPGIVDLALDKIRAQHENLKVVWTDHGYRTGSEAAVQVRELNASHPDILLVGMGTPNQELWIAQHRSSLNIPVIWCVGATADYLSGTRKVGPNILLTHQEWLGRLIAEPRRMWRRYLIGNPRFIMRMVKRRVWTPSQKKHSNVSKNRTA